MKREQLEPDTPTLHAVPLLQPPRFVKGGKPGPGRPKGAGTEYKADAKEFARRLVCNPLYRKRLAEDLEKRVLEPALEQMLWHYGFGRPKESLEVTWNLEALSTVELQQLHTLVKRVS